VIFPRFFFALKKHFLSIAQILWSEIFSPCFLSDNATEFKDFFVKANVWHDVIETRVAPERKVIEMILLSQSSQLTSVSAA
jgi:hypothetical protein